MSHLCYDGVVVSLPRTALHGLIVTLAANSVSVSTYLTHRQNNVTVTTVDVSPCGMWINIVGQHCQSMWHSELHHVD